MTLKMNIELKTDNFNQKFQDFQKQMTILEWHLFVNSFRDRMKWFGDERTGQDSWPKSEQLCSSVFARLYAYVFELKTNQRNKRFHPNVIRRCLNSIDISISYGPWYWPFHMPRIIRLVYLFKLPFQFGMD